MALPRHVLFLFQPSGLSRLAPDLPATHGHPDRDLPGFLRSALYRIVADAIVGHAPDSVTQADDSVNLVTMRDAMERITLGLR